MTKLAGYVVLAALMLLALPVACGPVDPADITSAMVPVPDWYAAWAEAPPATLGLGPLGLLLIGAVGLVPSTLLASIGASK